MQKAGSAIECETLLYFIKFHICLIFLLLLSGIFFEIYKSARKKIYNL